MRLRFTPPVLIAIGALAACSPVALDGQCRQRLAYPDDVDVGVTWEDRMPGWELFVTPGQSGQYCPVREVDQRGRPSAGSAVGTFAERGRLPGLSFYVAEKGGAQAWRGFTDAGLYTCGPGSKVQVRLRTVLDHGMPTLVGTYDTHGCRPELTRTPVTLRPFDWPPFVRCCADWTKRGGEE